MIADQSTNSQRRHDLDALRAAAMLLGIGLHAALSFLPAPWPVQDSQQNGLFGLFFTAVHGFRMPLFFLLSGFFTAMLWRRRGLKALLGHRFRRVFLPCILALVTIVPAVNWISDVAKAPSGIWAAARQGDVAKLVQLHADGADLNQPDPTWGAAPLSLAASANQTEFAKVLIEKGAKVNARDRNGGTPLHAAAFFGHPEVASVLLKARADPSLRNKDGSTAQETLGADWQLTKYIAGLVGIQVNENEINAGRAAVAELLHTPGTNPKSGTELPTVAGAGEKPANVQDQTQRAMDRAFAVTMAVLHAPIFNHLWFLWFLCWLVVGFAVYAKVADWRKWRGPPHWLVLSPTRFLWLIPLTMLPQWFMGQAAPSFGPDTSASLLPALPVLLYYAIFFGVGALYFDSDDATGRVGGNWWLAGPVALLIVFPLGLAVSFEGPALRPLSLSPDWLRLASVGLQVAYAWLMTFALMGLFRRVLSSESKWVRYLSDSAYWLYLAHLPLVIAAQLLVRSWPLPAALKFMLVCLAVCALLLFSYQTMIRYTWVGTLLNGPRTRPGQPPPLLTHSIAEANPSLCKPPDGIN